MLTALTNSIVGSFPVIALSSDSMNVFGSVGEYVSVIGHYVPVDTFMICVGVIFAMWIVVAVISTVLQLL